MHHQYLFLLLSLNIVSNFSFSQNLEYPKPVAHDYKYMERGEFTVQFEAHRQYFYMYEVENDITFSKLAISAQRIYPGSNFCYALDFAIYKVEGNKIFTYIGQSYETDFELKPGSPGIFLTVNLPQSFILKKGKYYFGFQRKIFGNCVDQIQQVPIYGYRCVDYFNGIMKYQPTAFNYTGNGNYIPLPVNLPLAADITANTNHKPNTYIRYVYAYEVIGFRLIE